MHIIRLIAVLAFPVVLLGCPEEKKDAKADPAASGAAAAPAAPAASGAASAAPAGSGGW
ncbi:MAG: hypothetical protein KF819_32010 [Labilithrix sp.]|nr:hypothetical protein [Labilithrix sp.]